MKVYEFSYESSDGTVIHAYKWVADNEKAVVQITHGAVEHAMRYDDFARALAERGCSVYASDIRGHGKTAGCPENVGYFSDKKGGFDAAVDDTYALTKKIKEENPGLKVFLLGHSMGSLIARVYAARYGNDLSGVMLTGTGRVNPLLIAVVRALAKCIIILRGRRHKSPFLHSLIFGTLNRPFKSETKSAFICSDKAVVDAYLADEYCGNTSTAEFVSELLRGTRDATKKETFEKYPKELPLFIGSGEFDSMGGKNLKAVKKDAADFEKAGVVDMTFHIYEGMRHEILNEKQKKKVYADIIEWIDRRA
ncbi:MAG: lysophospholipase [Eubacteriales bacterium]|nr:lysophospholipase [Eubacteriales bacterium]